MTIGSLGAGIRLALTTTREHKMRSFLTVLGVIIGTGAVIGVGSIVAGLDGAITGMIRSFGPDTIIISKTTAMGQATREERARKPLTLENACSTSVPTCFRPTGFTPPAMGVTTCTRRNWPAPRKATPPAAPP
jgi:ABC-type lipoprotein release transport system permease subunit